MQLTNFSSDSRGVILYAMVCGRLPFGDDNQIRKMTTRELHFTRPISHGELLRLIIIESPGTFPAFQRSCYNHNNYYYDVACWNGLENNTVTLCYHDIVF